VARGLTGRSPANSRGANPETGKKKPPEGGFFQAERITSQRSQRQQVLQQEPMRQLQELERQVQERELA
jgi:hypothetical protein